jgi:hypothetical protein
MPTLFDLDLEVTEPESRPDTSMGSAGEGFEWERIDSLMGRDFRLDPERKVKLPTIHAGDHVGKVFAKVVGYIAKTQRLEGLSDAQIAVMAGFEPWTPSMREQMPASMPEIREAYGIPDDDRIAMAADGHGRPVFLSCRSSFRRQGLQRWRLDHPRFAGRGSWQVHNTAERLALELFLAGFASANPQVPDANLRFLRRGLEHKPTYKKNAWRFDEARWPEYVLPLVHHAIASHPEYAHLSEAEVRERAWTIPGVELVAAVNALPESLEHGEGWVTCPSAKGKVFVRRGAVEAELGTVRQSRASMNQAFARYISDQLDLERNFQLNREYVRLCSAGTSARVFEQKKNIPASHLAAAQEGAIAHTGDFRHIEIDADVDLDRFAHIEADYLRVRPYLARSPEQATLRFRKTGRHRAYGAYHPHARNIAVTPREGGVAAFIHEWTHHMDFTTGRTALSASPSFQPILRAAWQQLAATQDPCIAAKIDYFSTPTEVLSRTAEMYYHWAELDTSLIKRAEAYATREEYSSLEPLREQILNYWDRTITETGGRLPPARAIQSVDLDSKPAMSLARPGTVEHQADPEAVEALELVECEDPYLHDPEVSTYAGIC